MTIGCCDEGITTPPQTESKRGRRHRRFVCPAAARLLQPHEVGLTLAALVIERLARKDVIRLVVDDTLGWHTGKRSRAPPCTATRCYRRDEMPSSNEFGPTLSIPLCRGTSY
jgi:hypothetical protein